MHRLPPLNDIASTEADQPWLQLESGLR